MESETSNPAGLDAQPIRRRGFLLTAWLTLLSFGTLFSAYIAVTQTPVILESYPDTSAFVLWTKTALAVMNVALLAAIWMWKRWAVYGLGISTLLVFILNVTANQEWTYFLTGFLGYTVLLLLISATKRWKHFVN